MCEWKKWQISGMIVWGCPISSLRAESARAVGGGRLFDISTGFFTKTAITRERKVDKSLQGGKWRVSPKATNGRLTKIGVVWQKMDFWPKTEILDPMDSNHVLATTGKSCSKKKVAFSQINISLLTNFGWFFGLKCIFGQKNTFQLNVKTAVSP